VGRGWLSILYTFYIYLYFKLTNCVFIYFLLIWNWKILYIKFLIDGRLLFEFFHGRLLNHNHEGALTRKSVSNMAFNILYGDTTFKNYSIVPLKATVFEKFTFTTKIEILSLAPHYRRCWQVHWCLEKATDRPPINRKKQFVLFFTCLSCREED
jgi:hypothetical protein